MISGTMPPHTSLRADTHSRLRLLGVGLYGNLYIASVDVFFANGTLLDAQQSITLRQHETKANPYPDNSQFIVIYK